MDTGSTFGRWLRQRRRLLDLTQADLAGRAGCSEITIRKIEADERIPSERVAGLLAAGLEVPPAEHPALIAFARGLSHSNDARPHAPPPRTTARDSALSLAPLTTLIGREEDAARIGERLLDPHLRLLTLVGPPGIGKTRLSLYVADRIRPHVADGVCFIALAPIRDPALVIPTLAQELGVQHGGQPPAAALHAALREKRMLLVLDNFEQVAVAAPQIAELLQMAPLVKALITSRAALNIGGEQLYAVPPLALPDPGAAPAPDDLARCPAVQLFAERVRAANPDFVLTAEQFTAVAEICARLDGLPLAIELAAARSKLFTPQALLDRLRGPDGPNALTMLVNGPRDLLEHQRALRSTLDWSYELLGQDERAVFMGLGIFVGGCTNEAAQAVCSLGDWRLEIRDCGDTSPISNLQSPILQELESLVNQSLLQVEPGGDGEARFTMLETIREYALEKLAACGALAAARRRHAAYYGALVLAENPGGAEREQAIEQLGTESGNIWAALEWYADHDPDKGLRCAAALRPFWLARGLLSEGRAWLARLLGQEGAPPAGSAARALALAAAGHLACQQGDYQHSEALLGESLALCRRLDDTRGIAEALRGLGSAAFLQSSFARAEALLDESLALCRRQGDTRGIAEALRGLALIAKDRGDFARAARLGDECLALHRKLGDRRAIARTLFNLSTIAYWQGQYDRSGDLAEQAARVFEELGDQMGLAYALEGIGMVAYKQAQYVDAMDTLARSFELLRALDEKPGMALALHEMGLVAHALDDLARAARLHREGLALAWQIGDRRRVAFCLEGLAATIRACRPLQAARLLGAAEALRDALGAPVPPSERAGYESSVAAARAAADRTAFEAAWADGRALALAQAVGEALDD